MALAAAVIAAGALTFGFLSMLTPRYTSSAEVLIARDESSYPRRSGEAAFPLESLRVDAGDVANQVEVILSPDLLARVAREIDERLLAVVAETPVLAVQPFRSGRPRPALRARADERPRGCPALAA